MCFRCRKVNFVFRDFCFCENFFRIEGICGLVLCKEGSLGVRGKDFFIVGSES